METGVPARPAHDRVAPFLWMLLVLMGMVTALCAGHLQEILERHGIKEYPIPTARIIKLAGPVVKVWYLAIPIALVGAVFLWRNPFPAARPGILCALATAAFLGWMGLLVGIIFPLAEMIRALKL